jgi:hypothetical protein
MYVHSLEDHSLVSRRFRSYNSAFPLRCHKLPERHDAVRSMGAKRPLRTRIAIAVNATRRKQLATGTDHALAKLHCAFYKLSQALYLAVLLDSGSAGSMHACPAISQLASIKRTPVTAASAARWTDAT